MASATLDIWRDLKETAVCYAEREGCTLTEVCLLEPGFRALAAHRLANALYRRRWYFLARWLSLATRKSTGIEIHPGARLGRRCLFVPGTGCVVGETAVVGDDCRFDAGVMLLGGGQGVAHLLGRGQAAVARDLTATLGPSISTTRMHPTLGHRVVLEPGTVLVGDIFVGNDVRVLAGAVVIRDVPDGGVAVGVPGRVLRKGQAVSDPDARALKAIAERFYLLEERVQVLAFAMQQAQAGPGERWRTSEPREYGPIAAVEDLIDGSGI